MNDEIKKLYGELFDALQDTSWAGKDLAAFKLQLGKEYPIGKQKGILFVGRAVNGWNSLEWERKKFVDEKFPPTENDEKETTFSEWLKHNGNDRYSLTSSAFWRVSKRVFEKLYGNGAKFHADIAWSDLYKISRQAANPTPRLCNLQFECCKKILFAEINFLKPRYIVFLTGLNWANDFLDEGFCEIEKEVESNSPLHACGMIKIKHKSYPFVVTPHPQGKKEDPIVDAVVEKLQDLLS